MAIHTFTDRRESQPKGATPETSVDIKDFDIPELQRTLKLAGLLKTPQLMPNLKKSKLKTMVKNLTSSTFCLMIWVSARLGCQIST